MTIYNDRRDDSIVSWWLSRSEGEWRNRGGRKRLSLGHFSVHAFSSTTAPVDGYGNGAHSNPFAPFPCPRKEKKIVSLQPESLRITCALLALAKGPYENWRRSFEDTKENSEENTSIENLLSKFSVDAQRTVCQSLCVSLPMIKEEVETRHLLNHALLSPECQKGGNWSQKEVLEVVRGVVDSIKIGLIWGSATSFPFYHVPPQEWITLQAFYALLIKWRTCWFVGQKEEISRSIIREISTILPFLDESDRTIFIEKYVQFLSDVPQQEADRVFAFEEVRSTIDLFFEAEGCVFNDRQWKKKWQTAIWLIVLKCFPQEVPPLLKIDGDLLEIDGYLLRNEERQIDWWRDYEISLVHRIIMWTKTVKSLGDKSGRGADAQLGRVQRLQNLFEAEGRGSVFPFSRSVGVGTAFSGHFWHGVRFANCFMYLRGGENEGHRGENTKIERSIRLAFGLCR